MNNVAYFEIQANNPIESARFYEQIFGWTFERAENVPLEYYRIITTGMHGGLFKRPADTPPLNCGTNAFTCSIQVENFDAMAEKILKNGGKVAMPKFAIEGLCYQGYFLDLDNNVFGIFEPNTNAK